MHRSEKLCWRLAEGRGSSADRKGFPVPSGVSLGADVSITPWSTPIGRPFHDRGGTGRESAKENLWRVERI